MTAFRLRPMPAPVPPPIDPVRVAVDAPNAYPCRRCLSDGLPGETMHLLSYNPFLGDSPYTAAGPIFLHAQGCEPWRADGGGVPDQLRRRLLAVRSYNSAHFLVDSDIVEGSDLKTATDRMLADHEVAYLHVHFARAGCFATRIERSA